MMRRMWRRVMKWMEAHPPKPMPPYLTLTDGDGNVITQGGMGALPETTMFRRQRNAEPLDADSLEFLYRLREKTASPTLRRYVTEVLEEHGHG